MKYGAHLYLWADRWRDESLELIDRAKALGLDLFDIAVGDDIHVSPKLVSKRAEALGIEVAFSPGGHWPIECDISDDDPVNRELGLEWHRHWLDVAGETGAVAYSGALYGHPGKVLHRGPLDEEYERTAENLHKLAEHAERAGVKFVLEPMSHFRTHLVNRPQQVMQLIEMSDHRNLHVLFDTYHMVTEVRDYAEAVRIVGDRLWGIHACESDRGIPGGGLVPWSRLFGALHEITFDGYVIMESYNSSVGDFAHGRGMFHDVCPDGDEFVRRGLEFLYGFDKDHSQHGA